MVLSRWIRAVWNYFGACYEKRQRFGLALPLRGRHDPEQIGAYPWSKNRKTDEGTYTVGEHRQKREASRAHARMLSFVKFSRTHGFQVFSSFLYLRVLRIAGFDRFLSVARVEVGFCWVLLGFVRFSAAMQHVYSRADFNFFSTFSRLRARICGFMRFLRQIVAFEYTALQSGNFLLSHFANKIYINMPCRCNKNRQKFI